jgi:hypothetical protein
MENDYARIWPYLIAGLAVLLVYRRLRRSFGPQRIRPIRMNLRIGILILLAGSLVPLARSNPFLFAELAGLVIGVALGVWGAQRTRFQTRDGQLHYVPHTYTGIVVSLLLVGRLAYRLVIFYSMGRANGSSPDFGQDFTSPTMVKSPFTVALLFVVIGYSVCYYSMVLWKSKRISPEDLEVPPTSTLASP